MRRIIVLTAALALLVGMSLPAGAVMFGEPDVDNEFDNVALLLFAIEDEEAEVFLPSHRCTGTLVDDDVVLTAGHCTAEPPLGEGQAWVVLAGFEHDFEPESIDAFLDFDPDEAAFTDVAEGVIRGEAETHPEFEFPSHDLGVVHLDEPPEAEPAELAEVGTLDELATARGLEDVTFDIAGYGLQGVQPVESDDWTRHTGTVQLVTIRSSLTAGFGAVQVTSNPGEPHRGGLCFGDSGGAVFHGEEIVAVNSFVLNEHCMGSGFSIRTDDAGVQQWVDEQRDAQ